MSSVIAIEIDDRGHIEPTCRWFIEEEFGPLPETHTKYVSEDRKVYRLFYHVDEDLEMKKTNIDPDVLVMAKILPPPQRMEGAVEAPNWLVEFIKEAKQKDTQVEADTLDSATVRRCLVNYLADTAPSAEAAVAEGGVVRPFRQNSRVCFNFRYFAVEIMGIRNTRVQAQLTRLFTEWGLSARQSTTITLCASRKVCKLCHMDLTSNEGRKLWSEVSMQKRKLMTESDLSARVKESLRRDL